MSNQEMQIMRPYWKIKEEIIPCLDQNTGSDTEHLFMFPPILDFEIQNNESKEALLFYRIFFNDIQFIFVCSIN